ncbi:MAG TPA: hypothetical protein DDX84_07700 [Nitrospiraceae bacterium]|nr:MAG: hypothetical protein A3D21_02920 [Nitrospirae bacterium RIFCSPHIGHO2_02_FULL_42_12]HAS16735.1 hypothetical protein [Nitrospiraceae bacterium]HBI24068.1 hypothetical protein [Nitrospiraceae bacterium]
MKYDSVIIGSGITGLTSALVLAQHGYRVAIVEKNRSIAPLLRRFKRGNVWCDPGFHYSGGFEESGVLSILLRYLRMRDDIRPIPMVNDGYDILYLDDREIPIPCGMEQVGETLCTYFPRSKQAINKYIEKIRLIMEATPFVNFDINWDDFARSPYNTESLEHFLDSVGAEEDLKELLGQYGRFLYGVSAGEVPLSIHALIMGSFYKSPKTLMHGGDEIVDAYEKRLQQEGVDIFCNNPAIKIEVDDNRRLKTIKTGNGEMLECEHCISTIHPSLLADILPADAVRPAYLSRLRGLENTNPPFAVYLEVDNVPEKIAYSNLYKLSRLTEKSIGVMACDPIKYDNKKRGLCILRESPENKFPKERYGSYKRTAAYIEYKQRETNNLVTQFKELLPGIAGGVKVVDSATSYTYERYTGTPGGSMYGVKQSVNQIKLSSLTAIRGFYLAGQSIHLPGIMGGVISGFLGASNIIGLETIWNEVRECR